jgi:hypothetical protein
MGVKSAPKAQTNFMKKTPAPLLLLFKPDAKFYNLHYYRSKSPNSATRHVPPQNTMGKVASLGCKWTCRRCELIHLEGSFCCHPVWKGVTKNQSVFLWRRNVDSRRCMCRYKGHYRNTLLF